MPAVILDTNVFVAAGFNPRSASARILRQVRQGRLRMVWSQPTRRETQRIVEKIPPLSWERVRDLFREEDRCSDEVMLSAYDFIRDPDDRKFAALADATGAALVTNDDDLLTHRQRVPFEVLTPHDYWETYGDQRD